MNIAARPNINGNNEADFQEAYQALHRAKVALDAARGVLGTNVLHGRNYQHIAGADDVLISDKRAFQEVYMQASGLIGGMMSLVVDALRDDV